MAGDGQDREVRHEYHHLASGAGEPIGVRVVLPAGYDRSARYPLLVGLPPGLQNLAAVDFLLDHYWGDQAARRGWVVVSPEAPSGGWTRAENRPVFSRLLDLAASFCELEGGRIHLAGCSNGGRAALALALAFPGRFRSLTLAPGGLRAPSDLERLRGLRVTQFVGERDRTWGERAEVLHGELIRLGIPSELHVVAGAGHFIESLGGGALMDSLDSQRRVGSDGDLP